MQTKTIEERLRGLAEGWAYKQLVSRDEALKQDPIDEKARLTEESYQWVHRLFHAELKYHIKALCDSGQLIGITTDEQIRAKTQEEHAKFIEAARTHLPAYVRILDLLKKHREAEERKKVGTGEKAQ